MSQVSTASKTTIFRNKERRNVDAKRSFKHGIPKANVPKEFPQIDCDFWFVCIKANEHNKNKQIVTSRKNVIHNDR